MFAPSKLTVLTLGMMLTGTGLAWGQDPQPATQTQAVQTPTDPEIAAQIQRLNSPQFEEREAASRRLIELGVAGVPALLAAAKSDVPEEAIRAADVLAVLYRTLKFPEAESTESAIAELRGISGPVGDRARRSWDANATGREDRAIARIESLGGRVQYYPEDDPRYQRFAAKGKKVIQFIVVSRKWTAGDEGLKLFSMLNRPEEILIYHVNGAQVSEEAMQKLSDLGYRVDRRGAFLGISNNPINFEGCHVGQVTANSPAERGGLQAGDRIVKFGEHEIIDFEDLIGHLQKREPGDKVEFVVARDGELKTLPVELGNW